MRDQGRVVMRDEGSGEQEKVRLIPRHEMAWNPVLYLGTGLPTAFQASRTPCGAHLRRWPRRASSFNVHRREGGTHPQMFICLRIGLQGIQLIQGAQGLVQNPSNVHVSSDGVSGHSERTKGGVKSPQIFMCHQIGLQRIQGAQRVGSKPLKCSCVIE